MKFDRCIALAGAGMLVAGCALLATPLASTGHSRLMVLPQVTSGFHAQAALGAYSQASINHLQVRLFRLQGSTETACTTDGGAPLMVDLPQASLSVSVTFANLAPDTTYRVRACAYLDAGTGNLISTTDAGSYADVVVGHDDRPTFSTLPVRLLDQSFNAQASSSIAITPGGFGTTSSMSVGFHLASVTTFVGMAGATGSADGFGSAARFMGPAAFRLDGAGNAYVMDFNASTLRKVVLATGEVITVAGSPNATGSANGTGASARFNNPTSMALDGAGNAYVADMYNDTIRKVVLATGEVTTFAGTAGTGGASNLLDGTGTEARFSRPASIIYDGAGNLLVSDSVNVAIRKIVIASAEVTTLATGVVSGGMAVDGSGNLYSTGLVNNVVWKIVIGTGTKTVLAGVDSYSNPGSADGVGTAASFYQPTGIVWDGSGCLYVADTSNNTIRKITLATAQVETFMGSPGATGSVDGLGGVARFKSPTSLAIGGGYLYVSDSGNYTVRKIAL